MLPNVTVSYTSENAESVLRRDWPDARRAHARLADRDRAASRHCARDHYAISASDARRTKKKMRKDDEIIDP
ncbi:hypothetical protein EVAR_18550_1 [Eumeta japonica]|uniref:Uncharacterized protein n=1 Tax=Eumeta variegata TaxID=151549 RepID=A0A4C1V474_EUMVA|nr:hypothetical protein EVAR_18550_1 [Eumeta japonica]